MTKALRYCMLLLSLTTVVSGQQNAGFDQSYPNYAFVELLNKIEANREVKFYYQDQWIDSLTIIDSTDGIFSMDLATAVLKQHGFNTYVTGNEIYIYPGSPIVGELPHFHKWQSAGSEAELDQKNEGGQEEEYLQTKDVLGEKAFLIGRKQDAIAGRLCRVNGRIINQRSGEPLFGATIYIRELYQGKATDGQGAFFLDVLPGEYTMVVNHLGMEEKQYELWVYTDGQLSIELEDEIIELEEITVSFDRFDNVKSMNMGYNRISMKEMKEIPAVMGERDVLKVAQMLPGVQNVGEGTAGFNVRGGSADQNMFYLNKISVYNTSHLFGFFTAFSSDIIRDFSLYKNNFPSRYGGRVASVFEINTRPGDKNKFFAQGGISPVTANVALEVPLVKNKVSLAGSFRSTYSDWLLKQMKNTDLQQSEASFYDMTLGIHSELNENNQIKLFYYHSSDRFSLSSTNDYWYSNTGASLGWNHRFNSNLSAEFSVVGSGYQFSTVNKENISEAYSQEYSIRQAEARADLILLRFRNHRIEFGAGSILYDLNRGNIVPYGSESTRIPIELGREQGLETALYISDEFRIAPRLDLMLGLRYSFYTRLGPGEVFQYVEGEPMDHENIFDTIRYSRGEAVKSYSGPEPRVALNYRIGDNGSIKASYNRLQQYIFLLSNTIAIAPNDQWKLTGTHIEPIVADQLSVGYYQNFKKQGISASVEYYKKWINNVVAYKDGADFISQDPIETQVLQGTQKSQGVEFLVRKNTNKLTGWLSYTYSRSLMHIESGKSYPSDYDRPHSLNIVSNYRFSRRISLSANVVYTSGRPVTLPVSIYYSEGQQLLLYSERNQYRIPDYFRIDLSANLEGNLKFKKFGHSYWMINIYNLTGRENAYSVFYTAEEGEIKGYILSIFARPIVTLSWHFKLGNYSND